MITVSSPGSFKKTEALLKRLKDFDLYSDLDRYGRMGVEALSRATPAETGLTAHSWEYRILKSKLGRGIGWYNTNAEDGVNVAILIQYGHGTGTGGYIQGQDYINPAIQPLFDQISEDIRKKVTLV